MQKPRVTVIDSKGNVVSADNYSVSYSNSGSKKVGSYGIYISFIGSKYSGSISYVYKIIPKSSAISSLKGAKKKITVKYKSKPRRQQAIKFKWQPIRHLRRIKDSYC